MLAAEGGGGGSACVSVAGPRGGARVWLLTLVHARLVQHCLSLRVPLGPLHCQLPNFSCGFLGWSSVPGIPTPTCMFCQMGAPALGSGCPRTSLGPQMFPTGDRRWYLIYRKSFIHSNERKISAETNRKDGGVLLQPLHFAYGETEVWGVERLTIS